MSGNLEGARITDIGRNIGIVVETQGFNSDELVTINASDLRTATKELGLITSDQTHELLNEKRKEADFESSLGRASEMLNNLKSLSEEYSNVFTTPDGINHLKNYLDTLEGYCEGAGITENEGALLQIEDTTGCETLIVKNDKTGEIAGIHTEEDSDSYSSFGSPEWGKRWVKMNIGDREIQFCYYAGVCAWGGASGIVSEDNRTFFQAADTIAQPKDGVLWANAVAFMFMDSANLNDILEMSKKIRTLPAPIFSSGYIINMVEGGKNTMETIEVGGDYIMIVEPVKTSGRTILAGSNFPLTEKLQKIDGYISPQEENESDEEYEKRKNEQWAMVRRVRRLIKIGQTVGRGGDIWWGEGKTLKATDDVMKNPHGDIVSEWFTGLSNDLVAQHDLLYVSPSGQMTLNVRKGYPKPRNKKN